MARKKVEKSKANKVKKIKASLKLRAAAKPKSKMRKKPGMGSTRNSVPSRKGTKVPSSSGKGKFYRVVVRDKNDFVMFRNHDVGKKGHVERLAGKRANGRWATVSWLIDKKEAHISKGVLVGDSKDVKDVLGKLSGKPRHLKGDIFEAGPRKNIPERLKPTPAMKRAQKKNIKKAQAARRKKKK